MSTKPCLLPSADRHADIRLQSGPMLVIDERYIRVFERLNLRSLSETVSARRKMEPSASFVISNKPVTFHHFARFFRDHLGLSSALYFDGNVSRLYAPELNQQVGQAHGTYCWRCEKGQIACSGLLFLTPEFSSSGLAQRLYLQN